jgi:hypothetical protein
MTLKEVKENPPMLDIKLIDVRGVTVGGILDVQVNKMNQTNGFIVVKGRKVVVSWEKVHRYTNSHFHFPVNVD